MKYLVLVLLVLVAGAAAIFIVPFWYSDSPEGKFVDSPAASKTDDKEAITSIPGEKNPNEPNIPLKASSSSENSPKSDPAVSEAALLAEQRELEVMVEDYEEVKSDRDAREQHLEVMTARLNEYNKKVLPLALEKVKESKLE